MEEKNLRKYQCKIMGTSCTLWSLKVYTRSKIRFNPTPKFILWLKEGYIWLFWAFDKKSKKYTPVEVLVKSDKRRLSLGLLSIFG